MIFLLIVTLLLTLLNSIMLALIGINVVKLIDANDGAPLVLRENLDRPTGNLVEVPSSRTKND